MGFITIETVVNEGSRFCFEIESEGLYTINCLTRTPIRSPDKICKICILPGMVVIRTEDRDFRDGRQTAPWEKGDRLENNIIAYDWQGNKLWNIGEIVGDIKEAFLGVCYISREKAQAEFSVSLPENTGPLLGCNTGCRVYLVDAVNQKLLCKVSGKY